MNTDFLYKQFVKVPQKLLQWHIENNVCEIPDCEYPSCENPVHYKKDSIKDKEYPYNRFCSDVCRKENRKLSFEDEAKRAAKLYQDGWPFNRIVTVAKISPSVAKRGIKNAGLKMENRRLANKKLLDPDWLEKKYVDEGLTLEAIANESGTYKGTVYRWLEFHGIDSRKALDPNVKSLLMNKDWLGNEFKTKSLATIANEINVSELCVRKHAKRHNLSPSQHVSAGQNELFEFISSISPYESIQDSKIDGVSIDIISGKFAFEYNGIYWHCEESSGRGRNYHLKKTKHMELNGYKLFHIFESEWDLNPDKKEIWKSMLTNIFEPRVNHQLSARNLSIHKITFDEKNRFLNEHHLQGQDYNSTEFYALVEGDTPISVMTFGKPRFGGSTEWELHRFATMKYHHVNGAASRLFKAFQREHSPKSVVSYADRRFSTGGVYNQLGFICHDISSPSYYYTKNHRDLLHKTKFQKKNLPKLLDHFDPALSEWDNMKINGYDRIWDCGHYVFVWTP